MEGGGFVLRTVDNVFEEFKARRAGLIKALTTDVEEFYQQCDPDKVNLCLFGFPDETWEVNLPAKELPPELPEPALGINFARDGQKDRISQVAVHRDSWLHAVAVHSDSWLHAVSVYHGGQSGFDKNDRKRLLNMINELPTIYEVVPGKMEGYSVRYTVDKVFEEFKARRAGLIKALTTDVVEFYQQCDPDKDNLCLYGFPDKTWKVNLPAEEVPPELPEPALGINFARDRMPEKDWLSLVAVQSDSWLHAVSVYYGGRLEFDKHDRKRLLNMINELPTIYEVMNFQQYTKISQTKRRKKISQTKRRMKISQTKRRMKKISERFCCSNKRALV